MKQLPISELNKASNTTIHYFWHMKVTTTIWFSVAKGKESTILIAAKKGKITTQQSVKTKGTWMIISYTHAHILLYTRNA